MSDHHEGFPLGESLETEPGVFVERRCFLKSAALALGAVQLPGVARVRAGGNGTFIGANGAPGPFVILHWKMNPGSQIGRHAHSYGNVVTLGLHGAARVEDFEVIGKRDYDDSETFQVRRTLSQWLTPGGINLVNLERNYIHGFQAGPNGARGLDITTRILPRRATPNLELGAPSKDHPEVFSARWAASS